jgi:hypothetical protein
MLQFAHVPSVHVPLTCPYMVLYMFPHHFPPFCHRSVRYFFLVGESDLAPCACPRFVLCILCINAKIAPVLTTLLSRV